MAPGNDQQKAQAYIDPRQTAASINDTVARIPLTAKVTWAWVLAAGLGFVGINLLLLAIVYTLAKGVGIWGINVPVAWGFAIVNFVWWIGIGHAGTFISAFLLLMHQDWRTSINRLAEAMTLFAVMCAGLFPLLHLGRPWLFYFLLPYPDTMDLWPQWRSPLIWDVFAVSTYFAVSLLFWYTGLIPDLATMRDRARNRFAKLFYGTFALGWRGSSRHWARYESAYLLLGGLATPLVISVHSVVSLDFAVAIVPGWHSTFFPPYFVAGAIFSGFAMVLTLCIPLRRLFHLEGLITAKHLDNMAKVMLVTGLIVAYSYGMEAFMAWYGGDLHDWSMMVDRATGTYAPCFWALIVCNVLTPQALWSRRVRSTPWLLFIIAIIVNIGMWLERFTIVVQSLSHDYLSSTWRNYAPTRWDWCLLIGTVGFFLFNLTLFLRLMPAVSMAEARQLAHRAHGGTGSAPGDSALGEDNDD